MRPFEDQLRRLDTIPGVGRRVAEEIIAEVGVDMERFPSAAQPLQLGQGVPGAERECGQQRSCDHGIREPLRAICSC